MQALTVDNFTAKSGNMSVWANQGVLLLNSALTTRHKTMKAHHVWEPYTNYILKKIIEKMPDTILLLWGADARKKACAKHVLKWSLPRQWPITAYPTKINLKIAVTSRWPMTY